MNTWIALKGLKKKNFLILIVFFFFKSVVLVKRTITNLGEYHDIYLKTDVLSLCVMFLKSLSMFV